MSITQVVIGLGGIIYPLATEKLMEEYGYRGKLHITLQNSKNGQWYSRNRFLPTNSNYIHKFIYTFIIISVKLRFK